ncbi:cingulin-like [Lepisosteus oculatus]|uniref:cingulin-like n=1 Tax=Lepisosteus oculatus TaxID=7918 RepID=UPI003719ADD5
MSGRTDPADRKAPVDHGVQIRFINDLHEPGGVVAGRRRSGGRGGSSSSSYGVAVRVQGIAGQPYVVLKEGEKGDSYGVQLKSGAPQPPLPAQPLYHSLPRKKSEERLPDNPYSETAAGHPSSQAGLRRVHSQGSLLDREDDFDAGLYAPHRPPGDGRSGSSGALDGGAGGGGPGRDWPRDGERGSGGVVAPAAEPESRAEPWSRRGSGLANGAGRSRGWGSGQAGESFPEPEPERAPSSVDTKSLAPINSLISRFDGGGGGGGSWQARGRPGGRRHLLSEDHKRSQSLDGYLDEQVPAFPPPPSPKAPATALPPPSAPHSAGSLGRGSGSVAEVTALTTSAPASYAAPDWSTRRAVSKETLAKTQTDSQMKATPDLLKDQGQRSEGTSEEEQTRQTIYSILREGSQESEMTTKRKVSLVFEKIQGLKSSAPPSEVQSLLSEKRDLERRVQDLQNALNQERKRPQTDSSDQALKAELEDCLDENLQLQEQLDRKNNELHQTQAELTQLRMDREAAEARVRDLEDQLAGLQEELRREADSGAERDALATELVSLRAEMAEAGAARQRQEEALRQRERELTALKGALKEEVSSHDREIDQLRQQYQADIDKLRSNVEQVSMSQLSVEAERQKVNTTVKSLQKQLEESNDETSHWREQCNRLKEELRATKQELLQARLEKEEFEEELGELQERLSSMSAQLDQLQSSSPDPAQTERLTQELQRCRDDLLHAQSELSDREGEIARKRAELLSLKRTYQEQEAGHDREIDRLTGQHQREKEDLMRSLEQAKQSLGRGEAAAADLRAAQEEAAALRERVAALEQRAAEDKDAAGQLEDSNARLSDKVSRLEAERGRLQASLAEAAEAEQALAAEKRALEAGLQEAQRGAARLGQEREQLSQRLQEEGRQREQLRRGKGELEEQKRLLDRALEKLNKEMDQMASESHGAVAALQAQLDEYREKSRRELQEAQRQSKDKLGELEKLQGALRILQEEGARLKKELQLASEERDNAVLDKELLTNKLKSLEAELEAKKSSHTDRSREIRALEDKAKRLEMELEEERTSAELLTERISRSRDQIDQLRAELMQERSSKQDLELDKASMERQLKELRGRLSDLEGHQRPSANLAQLESRIQELEDRLQSEEREKSSLQSSQRRLERKVKELTIQLDEERTQFNDQKDQLALKVKALKRRVDEGEGEVERLEAARRKALRELEEQQERREQLEGKVTALEKELWRKSQSQRSVLDSTALSSDEEEGSYGPSSITSILTEGNLQTSSC